MLTNQCYTQLAVLLCNELQNGRGLSVAIDSGDASWDQVPAVYQRDVTALNNEIIRKVDGGNESSLRLSMYNSFRLMNCIPYCLIPGLIVKLYVKGNRTWMKKFNN